MSSNLAVAGEKEKESAGFVMGFKKNTPGGNADATLAASYPAWGIAHVGRIGVHAASASRCKLLLTEKIVINIYKCAALQEKFGAPCCAPGAGCNSPESGHRRLTLWRAGERIRQLQGIITITVTLHSFQPNQN